MPLNPIANEERMAGWLETAWLTRYLEHELSPDEVDWFEMYVLDKPELIAAIDADSNLRDGLAIAARSQPDVAAPGAVHRRGRRRHRPFAAPLAWAASMAVAVGLGWFLAQQSLPFGTRGAEDSPVIVASPTRIVFDVLRGVEEVPTVFPGAPDSRYLLVEIGMPTDATDVQMLLDSHPPLPLAVSAEGFASFLVARERVELPTEITLQYASRGSLHRRKITLTSKP